MSFDRISWPRRTDRLSIRPATHDDLEALGRIQNQAEVAYWLPSAVGTQADYLLRMGSGGLLPRTLVVELEEAVIGELYLHVTDGWAQVEVSERATDSEAEIGWGLDPVHQGHGYATEAAGELMRLAFTDLGVRRVRAAAAVGNDASHHVLLANGLRPWGTERLGAEVYGGRADLVWYDLLVEEWRGSRRAAGTLIST